VKRRSPFSPDWFIVSIGKRVTNTFFQNKISKNKTKFGRIVKLILGVGFAHFFHSLFNKFLEVKLLVSLLKKK
jgi:hypothetical protein